MTKTSEEPIPVEETYRTLLRAAVKAAGGQVAVAKLAGVDQATISRTTSYGARATYTTLRKLSAVLPTIPYPIVAIRDADHERWCTAGALLQQHKPELFRSLMAVAEDSIGPKRPSDEKLAELKAVVSDPMLKRKRSKK